MLRLRIGKSFTGIRGGTGGSAASTASAASDASAARFGSSTDRTRRSGVVGHDGTRVVAAAAGAVGTGGGSCGGAATGAMAGRHGMGSSFTNSSPPCSSAYANRHASWSASAPTPPVLAYRSMTGPSAPMRTSSSPALIRVAWWGQASRVGCVSVTHGRRGLPPGRSAYHSRRPRGWGHPRRRPWRLAPVAEAAGGGHRRSAAWRARSAGRPCGGATASGQWLATTATLRSNLDAAAGAPLRLFMQSPITHRRRAPLHGPPRLRRSRRGAPVQRPPARPAASPPPPPPSLQSGSLSVR